MRQFCCSLRPPAAALSLVDVAPEAKLLSSFSVPHLLHDTEPAERGSSSLSTFSGSCQLAFKPFVSAIGQCIYNREVDQRITEKV